MRTSKIEYVIISKALHDLNPRPMKSADVLSVGDFEGFTDLTHEAICYFLFFFLVTVDGSGADLTPVLPEESGRSAPYVAEISPFVRRYLDDLLLK
jgi:hypothetical protein